MNSSSQYLVPIIAGWLEDQKNQFAEWSEPKSHKGLCQSRLGVLITVAGSQQSLVLFAGIFDESAVRRSVE